MDGRAASLTITDKIPYLLDAGFQPIVFSAITGIKDERFPHHQFLAWGPSGFRFDFRHWVANKYGRGLFYKVTTRTISLLLTPFIAIEKLCLGYSSQWSWALPAYIHGRRLIKSGKVDVVYSTGGAWSAHLAGLWLKKSTGIKLLSEIHDPLVIRKSPEDQGLAKPSNRDAAFRQKLEANLCAHADHLWWFTEGAMHYAKVRNPNLNTPENAHGFVVMPGAQPPSQSNFTTEHQYAEHLNLCHFGSLAKDRSLSVILGALNTLLQKHPEARTSIRIHAYGAPLDSLTIQAIERFGFDDLVIAHGRLEKDSALGKSGRERVIEKMQQADVLVLLHGLGEECAEYIPSKLYDYLWAGRPIWAITHRNPQLNEILSDRNAYLSASGNDAGILLSLEKIWRDWEKKRLNPVAGTSIGVQQAVEAILAQIELR
jgi:hypothetical protein